MKSLRPLVAREDVSGGVALRMADVQSGSRGIGKHVENVKFGWQLRGGHRAGKPVALGKRMPLREGFARVKGAESLL